MLLEYNILYELNGEQKEATVYAKDKQEAKKKFKRDIEICVTHKFKIIRVTQKS